MDKGIHVWGSELSLDFAPVQPKYEYITSRGKHMVRHRVSGLILDLPLPIVHVIPY